MKIDFAASTVLVTGADGFIGSHLTERLVELGANVRAFCLYNSHGSLGWLDRSPAAVRDRLDLRLGDIRDSRFVEAACEGVEYVFHLAALISIPYSYEAPRSYVETNVTGTLNVLEAARRHKPRRVIHTSTSEVYGTPDQTPIRETHPLKAQSPYAATKIAADQLALSYYRSFDVPVVVLRPFNTFGPRESTRAVMSTLLAQLLLGQREILLGRLDPRRDMTYVSDTVEGFVLAALAPDVAGMTIQLGTGRSVSVGELFEVCRRVTESTAVVRQDPRRLRPEQSEVLELLSDPRLAAETLDWRPQVSLEEGIRRTASWMRQSLELFPPDACMSETRAIPLCEPCLGGNAARYLGECVETNFVSSVGPFVGRFEYELAAWIGSPHAVACASGTAAIHVALRLAGLKPGDEVLVSSLTFIASANPIVYEYATPVFVDAEVDTWNLDPGLVVDELDRRARLGLRQPRAVEVVHVLGHPADIEPIEEACRRYEIPLIEDAAEALGACYTQGAHAGCQVGTIGRVGCFSFNGNKVITTGGGGMLVTAEGPLARRAKHLATQARCPGDEYWHDEVGYNYRLTNIAAALGVAQLEQLPEFLRRKRTIAAGYDAGLADLRGIHLPPRVTWAEPSHWLYAIRVQSGACGFTRQELAGSLASMGIQTRPIWAPLHQQPVFAASPRLGGSVAERLFAEGLTLPSSVGLGQAQQERVIQAIRSFHAARCKHTSYTVRSAAA